MSSSPRWAISSSVRSSPGRSSSVASPLRPGPWHRRRPQRPPRRSPPRRTRRWRAGTSRPSRRSSRGPTGAVARRRTPHRRDPLRAGVCGGGCPTSRSRRTTLVSGTRCPAADGRWRSDHTFRSARGGKFVWAFPERHPAIPAPSRGIAFRMDLSTLLTVTALNKVSVHQRCAAGQSLLASRDEGVLPASVRPCTVCRFPGRASLRKTFRAANW